MAGRLTLLWSTRRRARPGDRRGLDRAPLGVPREESRLGRPTAARTAAVALPTLTRPRLLDTVCTAVPYAFGSQRRGHPNLARALGVNNLNESAGGFAGLATLIWLAPSGVAGPAGGTIGSDRFLAALTAFGFLGPRFGIPRRPLNLLPPRPPGARRHGPRSTPAHASGLACRDGPAGGRGTRSARGNPGRPRRGVAAPGSRPPPCSASEGSIAAAGAGPVAPRPGGGPLRPGRAARPKGADAATSVSAAGRPAGLRPGGSEHVPWQLRTLTAAELPRPWPPWPPWRERGSSPGRRRRPPCSR